MGSEDVVIASVLMFFGLSLSILLVIPILLAFRKSIRQQSQRSRVKRAKEQLSLIDQLIESQRYADAIIEIQNAFILDSFDNRESVLQIREHNENVLSRSVMIAEARNRHIENIAEVERAILQHAEMQLARFRTDVGFQKIREKRAKQKKDLPAWTKHDLTRRHGELTQALATNRQHCETLIATLIQSLVKDASNEVLYH